MQALPKMAAAGPKGAPPPKPAIMLFTASIAGLPLAPGTAPWKTALVRTRRDAHITDPTQEVLG